MENKVLSIFLLLVDIKFAARFSATQPLTCVYF